MNILEHPIYKAIYDLCQEIEKLPASEQQTKIVVMASELEKPVRALIAERDQARAACAVMRQVLERSKHENLGHRCSDGWFIERDRALSTDCGKDLLERLERKDRALRQCETLAITMGLAELVGQIKEALK